MYAHLIPRPISGEYEEVAFNTNDSTVWVHFITDSGNEWVGAFGTNSNCFSQILEIDEKVFIVANGSGYLVNRNSQQLLYQHDDFYNIDSCLLTNSPDLILFSTYRYVGVIRQQEVKRIDIDYADGIILMDQWDNNAEGLVYQSNYGPYCHALNIDLESFDYNIDYSIKDDYYGYADKKELENTSILSTKQISETKEWLWTWFKRMIGI